MNGLTIPANATVEMLPDHEYNASWRRDDGTLLKAIVKESVARCILTCQRHRKLSESVPVTSADFRIYSVGEPPPFKPHKHECTALCPRNENEVVFEVHTKPDKGGKQVFTIRWYDGGPTKDIYVTPPNNHRAQVFNSKLDDYLKKHADRKQKVRIEERIRNYF